jgi:hypothetical protein
LACRKLYSTIYGGTALTNMIEASEKEAMETSGHKTRAVFERYHIVSERRLKEMTAKLDDYLKTPPRNSGRGSSIELPDTDRRHRRFDRKSEKRLKLFAVSQMGR